MEGRSVYTALVIEDTAAVRQSIVDILTFEKYEVFEASNGSDGIAMAIEHLPDVIVCDVSMPGIDGHEVLRRLRANASTARTPFIFLTALGSREDVRKGMEIGGDDYLTKPFDPEELLTAVESRLARSNEYAAPFRDLANNVASMIPHELRTPLAAIVGFADLLADPEFEPDDELRVAAGQAIRKAASRVERLVENYILYISLEQGRASEMFAISEPSADLAATIASAAAVQAENAGRGPDLHVEITLGSGCFPQTALLKIVHELVDNALKFSQPGTPIHVEGKRAGDAVVLSVEDNGAGMTGRQVKDIGAFVQFERGIREQQGSGLGLVIANRLVEALGGELAFRSTVGQGTSVTLTLTCDSSIG